MRMSTPLAALLAIAIVGGGGYVFLEWSSARTIERRDASRHARALIRAERAERLREQVEAQMEPLRHASEELMPDLLEGVRLGITLAELQEVRNVVPKQDAQGEVMDMYEEMLSSRSQVVYAVDGELDVLMRIQIMSSIPPRAVAPHLEAMVARYGAPTGIWNCPATGAGGIPMRRFTWRGSAVTVQDILLIHPGGVSQTLYIASTESIAASLRISHCARVRSREELDALPIATPEQMRETLQSATNVAL